MAKLYRNIGRDPFYVHGRFIKTGETTTLPVGCEAGTNLEEVTEPNPPAEPVRTGNTNSEMQTAARKSARRIPTAE